MKLLIFDAYSQEVREEHNAARKQQQQQQK